MPRQNKLNVALKNINAFAMMLNEVGFIDYLKKNEVCSILILNQCFQVYSIQTLTIHLSKVRNGIAAAVSAFRNKKTDEKEIRKVSKAWAQQSWQLKPLLVRKVSSLLVVTCLFFCTL